MHAGMLMVPGDSMQVKTRKPLGPASASAQEKHRAVKPVASRAHKLCPARVQNSAATRALLLCSWRRPRMPRLQRCGR